MAEPHSLSVTSFGETNSQGSGLFSHAQAPGHSRRGPEPPRRIARRAHSTSREGQGVSGHADRRVPAQELTLPRALPLRSAALVRSPPQRELAPPPTAHPPEPQYLHL